MIYLCIITVTESSVVSWKIVYLHYIEFKEEKKNPDSEVFELGSVDII